VATAVSIGVAAVGLVGAVFWTAAEGTHPLAAGASALASDVDIRIREAMVGAQARAETLAQLPRLAVAVATDARTFRDLTADELAFRPRRDEHIEIAQIPLGKRGGLGREPAARTLLRLPDDGLPLSMTTTGRHVMIGGGGLQAVAFEPVQPRERANELRGAIAVARRIDLSSFGSRLAALGLSGRIDLASGSFPLGGAEAPSGGVSTVVLGSAAAEPATLVLAGLAAPPSQRRFLGPVGLMVLSAVAARRLRRHRSLAAQPAPRRAASAPGAPRARMVALSVADAPTLVVDPPLLPLLEAESKPGLEKADLEKPDVQKAAPEEAIDDCVEQTARHPASGIAAIYGQIMGAAAAPSDSPPAEPDPSHTLPGDLFETDDVPLPPPHEQQDDLLEREYRTLYEEFNTVRQTCRQSPCALGVDRFVLLLRDQRDKLIRKLGARDVAFRLAFHNGKAVIRFNAGA
jgi:hypothetical protein